MNRRLRKIRFFVRKHRERVAFAGTFVLFVTFIVKEGLADRWKEQANAIDVAQYFYGLRIETLDAQKMILDLKEPQYRDQEAINKIMGTPSDFVVHVLHNLSDGITLMERISVSISNIQILMDRLPDQDANKKELKRIDSERYKYDQIFQNAYGLVSSIPGTERRPDLITEQHKIDYKTMQEKGAEEASEMETKTYNSWMVRRDLDLLVEKVLKEAQALRTKHDEASKYAWWIAAVLYSTGLGLGAIARFFHDSEA